MILGRPMFYDREGNPISHERYIELLTPAYESPEAHAKVKRVAGELVDDPEGREHFVSTVWLGMDHGLSCEGPPLIFETMVFEAAEGHAWFGPYHEDVGEQWRYSTETQAREGHAVMVALCRDRFLPCRRS